jgi:hypothetical protein
VPAAKGVVCTFSHMLLTAKKMTLQRKFAEQDEVSKAFPAKSCRNGLL